MVSGHRKYTDEQLRTDAKRFTYKWEWEQKSRSHYRAAKKRGKVFYEECCAHMPKRKARSNSKKVHI